MAQVFRANEILVCNACVDARNKDLPDAAAAQAHGVPARIPVIEVAHQAHDFGVRSPYGKAHAANTIHGRDMRAERVVALVVRALAVEVNFEVADQRWKAIRIVDGLRATVPQLQPKAIVPGF